MLNGSSEGRKTQQFCTDEWERIIESVGSAHGSHRKLISGLERNSPLASLRHRFGEFIHRRTTLKIVRSACGDCGERTVQYLQVGRDIKRANKTGKMDQYKKRNTDLCLKIHLITKVIALALHRLVDHTIFSKIIIHNKRTHLHIQARIYPSTIQKEPSLGHLTTLPPSKR